MTKICFDNIIYSLQKSGGISSQWAMLQEAMVCDNRFECNFIERYDANNNIFRNSINVRSDLITKHKFPLPLCLERYRNVFLKNSDADIFHSSYYRTFTSKGVKSVVTVHDFTYERFMSGWRRNLHCRQKYHAIRSADVVVCVSNNTLNDLLHFVPDIDATKITVIYNGILPDFRVVDNIERGDRLLYVGSRASYKNFELLIETLAETSHHIDICGEPLSYGEQKLLNRKIGHNRYKLHTNINNIELNKLYNSALCLVYPSSHEGFGLPIVEAQNAGCPVIALNTSSIPEIIGTTPLLLPNADKKYLHKALKSLHSPTLIDEAVDAGKTNAKRFSSMAMTDSYKELYLALKP